MEKLLLWINEKQLTEDTIMETIICEKARALYGDLLKQRPGTSPEETSTDAFKASHGWFDNFKWRAGVHSTVEYGETANSDTKATGGFVCEFRQLIAAEGYIVQQVFNYDETGLYWGKKFTRRTYITAKEKKMPGHKLMKDRLTLAFCTYASGDLKIKPLLVYHSENPRAFKSPKILKEELLVICRANVKAWITGKFLTEWVNLIFGPAVRKDLLENDLPLKALLILDNAPAYPPNFEDDILDKFKFIKVLYRSRNTTPI
ncbi:tigger transposable element-derived protein 1-like [Octopus sinensis]|uniref:Tigger transposable element-derived protein 1-like n=1 Tax=Octopus sinensis TaxID=2607531 RepID=A0A7E6F5P5_9MOLL|nr:tigger transposable element-derived protein 1-like [Octopus sinensis]